MKLLNECLLNDESLRQALLCWANQRGWKIPEYERDLDQHSKYYDEFLTFDAWVWTATFDAVQKVVDRMTIENKEDFLTYLLCKVEDSQQLLRYAANALVLQDEGAPDELSR